MNNKNKKTRLFVRILCAILAVIMTLSIVVPVVYATEVDTSTTAPFKNGDGFEYVEINGEWCLNVTTDNPIIRITNIAPSFTRDNLPILVANLDTFEVHTVNLLEMTGYVASVELPEGYYVIPTNNYYWGDTDSGKWALNNTRSVYFYHGNPENFQQDKYGLTYQLSTDIIDIPLVQRIDDSLRTIPARQTYHLTGQDAIYPLDELHNWDELQIRMEHLDLEATLEQGHAVYTDGYTPNSIPTTDTTGTTDNVTPPSADTEGGADTLGDLAASGGLNVTDNPNAMPEIPVAQPEIIVQPPVDNSTTQNPELPPVVTEPNYSGAQEQSKLEQGAEDALNTVYDKLGLVKDEETQRKEKIAQIIRNVILILLIAAVFVAYVVYKKRSSEQLIETLENNKYFDGHIE